MTRPHSLALAGLALALACSPALADGAQTRPVVHAADADRVTMEPQIADLHWLSGRWLGSDGRSDWESVYSSAEAGRIVGASKEMRGGRTVMIDFEHFYEREGQLRMTPYPFGKKSVEFTLTAFDADAKEAVFENPEHDFPKRFTYRRTGKNRLRIELVGDMNGQELRVELDLKRE